MEQFRISTVGKKFRHGGAALEHAKHLHPTLTWGQWHQGPNGLPRIVGKDQNSANDPVIVERVR